MSDEAFAVLTVFIISALLVIILTVGYVWSNEKIEMAKAGLQQCVVEGYIIWKKECK